MRILVNDLERHLRTIDAEIQEAIKRVITRGWFVLGPECAAFERDFSAYCGVNHCVGVGSGTDALELAFRALGLKSGSRIATVANAGYYTTTAILQIGAEPVFIDISEADWLMDLETLASLAKARNIDGAVITHIFGRMHDMEKARSLADACGIVLVEDCAQAHGAQRNGRLAGSVGHVGCFSFYPTKNLGAVGDGGAITTNDPAIASRLVALRQYGWATKYRVEFAGGRNSRLDELQAAVLRAKLQFLDGWNARRRDIFDRYTRGIHHRRVSCPAPDGTAHVAHLYVVTTPDPNGLRAHLAAADIGCDVHYPIPDHLQPALADRCDWPALPVTERLARQSLTLPCFPELTDEEVDRVVDQINGW